MPDSRPDGGVETCHDHAAVDRSGEGSLQRVLAFAIREYRVVFRANWTSGLTLAFALFSVGVVFLTRSPLAHDRVAAVVLSLTELGVYLVPLAAFAFGYGAVVDARERGTLEVLLSLPVRRRDVLLGIYLGRATALAGALAVGLGAGGLLLVQFAPGALALYLRFVAAAVVAGLAFLAVALCLSTVAREKSHALGGSLLVWAWFVLVHDLLALGAVVTLDLPTGALAAFLLANPADLFRLLVLSGTPTAGSGFAAVLAAAGLSPTAVVVGLVAWIVAPVAAAAALLGRR